MTKKLIVGVVQCLVFILILTSCVTEEDDGSRAFMATATVVEQSDNNYYCYLDGGGLVLSQDVKLEGAERGYFSFLYNKTDWKTTAKGITYIDNAKVGSFATYRVIHPSSVDNSTVDPNDNQLFQQCMFGRVYPGYFDFNTRVATHNKLTGEKIHSKIDIVYDLKDQHPDSLILRLYCSADIPSDWENKTSVSGNVFCDISQFATIQQWEDSVVVMLVAPNISKTSTKISKNDFLKPRIDLDD